MNWVVITRGPSSSPNTYYICECIEIGDSGHDWVNVRTDAFSFIKVKHTNLFDNFDSALRYLYRLRNPATVDTDGEIMSVLKGTYETERLKREVSVLRGRLSNLQTSYLNREEEDESKSLEDLKSMFKIQSEQALKEKDYLIKRLKEQEEAKNDLIRKIMRENENG